MNRFSGILKKINAKLNLPQPTKSRIILEIAADLDDLFNLYIKNGLSETEAQKKAEEKFDVSDEALSQLLGVHESNYKKFLNKISGQNQSHVEHAAFGFVLLFITVPAIRTIFTINFFEQASIFILPILGIAFAALILSIIKFFNLYIKKNHNIKTLNIGLTPLLTLGGMSLFTGVYGYFWEVYSAGGFSIFPGFNFFAIVSITSEFENSILPVANSLLRSSSLAIICMLVTISIALIWFVLINKVQKIEQAESEYLISE